MNFNQVLWSLAKGRKVRRMIWKKFNGFLYLEGDDIIYQDDTERHIYTTTLRNMLREDWEVIKEKEEESLSDQIRCSCGTHIKNANPISLCYPDNFSFNDIKKYVGLILNDINTFDVEHCCHGIQQRDIITILKRRLGDKLI